MKSQVFTQVLLTTYKIHPFGKSLNQDDLATLWLTLPQLVKDVVTDQMWAYASHQYMMDPNPSKDLAVHICMLRYLFRLENDMPNYSWGLKTDLDHRMKHAYKFHPQPTKPYLEAETKKPELTGKGVLAVLEGK